MSALDAIPPEIRRAACAFHEAGHIVVGRHHRRFITHAWLRPPHGFSGETCFEPYRQGFRSGRPADRDRAAVEIAILSAGHCGEMIFWNGEAGTRWYRGAIASHEDDLLQMQPYLAFAQPLDAAALQARCELAATAVLYRPAMRAAHAAIAAILVERRRIDRDEVEDVMVRSKAV